MVVKGESHGGKLSCSIGIQEIVIVISTAFLSSSFNLLLMKMTEEGRLKVKGCMRSDVTGWNKKPCYLSGDTSFEEGSNDLWNNMRRKPQRHDFPFIFPCMTFFQCVLALSVTLPLQLLLLFECMRYTFGDWSVRLKCVGLKCISSFGHVCLRV